MLHACKKFELHTLSSFTREIKAKINSYVIFGSDREFEKSENDNFRLLREFPVAALDCNNLRTPWPISAMHISLFSKS